MTSMKPVMILLMFVSLFPRLNSLSLDARSETEGPVIQVPSPDFSTIQEAIDNASVGATIIVASGIYNERLTINKSLTLLGQSRDTTIIDGLDSIYVVSILADNVIVQGFNITKSGVRRSDDGAVYISRSSGVTINSTFMSGTARALILELATDCVLSNNGIFNNTNGIWVASSSGNTFSGNDISNNEEGVVMALSDGNVFTGNMLSENLEDMFVSQMSKANIFFHNNFLDSVQTVSESTDSANIWSQNREGNFWGDYSFAERDKNADGIGDDPYELGEYDRDEYPLMGTYSDHPLSISQETYHVAFISNSSISGLTFDIGRQTGNRIIDFEARGLKGTQGFCRILIPTVLMDYPFAVVGDEGEKNVSTLAISDDANAYLYFTYAHDQRITVISSKSLKAYNEVLEKLNQLQADFDLLNATYSALLSNISAILQSYMGNTSENYDAILSSLDQLLSNYLQLNSSLQKNINEQSRSVENLNNLIYAFAATTAAFLITTVYLSSKAKANRKLSISQREE